MAAKPPSFETFREFYPYYLSEHSNRISRRLHVVGTLASTGLFFYALATGRWWLILAGIVFAYALAWTGHFVFEKNRPATFRHPFYSLRGDYAMLADVLRGRVPW